MHQCLVTRSADKAQQTNMLADWKINSPNNQKWLKAIGIYQIIGGALGLVFSLIVFFPFYNIISTVLLIPCTLLYGFSIFTGWTAYKLQDICINLTIANQTLQVIAISIGKYGFYYCAGAGLSFTLDFEPSLNIGFNFTLSAFDLSLNKGPDKYFFGLNLVALYILYKTEKISVDIKRHRAML